MKLIVLLITLGLERFLLVGNYLYRFQWFTAYVNLLKRFLGKSILWSGFVGVILTAIPILVAVAIIYYLLGWIFYGLVGFVLALAILIYCIGPRDLYTDLEAYFVAQSKDDAASVKTSLVHLVDEIPKDDQEISKAVTKGIFQRFQRSIFGVCFWFVVLGPLGAVLYRVMMEIENEAAQTKDSQSNRQSAAALLVDLLDWIPVRLLGIGFALVGDFHHGFSYWVQQVLTGWHNNQEFLENCGLKALPSGARKEKSKFHENKAALKLVDNTLILFLVVIALFVIGGWLS